jgi:hypothetical protein
MRAVSREEAGRFAIKKGGSGVVRTAVLAMKPGDILLIERQDWRQKNGPTQMLTRLKKGTGMDFKCEIVANGGGWLVERMR